MRLRPTHYLKMGDSKLQSLHCAILWHIVADLVISTLYLNHKVYE